MKKFIKSLFRIILEDLKNDFKAYTSIFVIVVLSTIPANFIENDITAILTIGVIAVVVLYVFYFYEPKG